MADLADFGYSNDGRVILHLDLDCFFVQVHVKLNPALEGKAVAVHQHRDLIAVSYEARKHGVERHQSCEQAKQKLPELELVSVPKDYGSKVSYKHYRRASEAVAGILRTQIPEIIEKASIDEFYMDITDLCAKRLKQKRTSLGMDLTTPWDGHVFRGAPHVLLPGDEQLQEGAKVAKELREAIFRQLGYTTSVGIACNKTLAKLAGKLNRPNQQTTVLRRSIPSLLAELAPNKLPKFGVKVGKDSAPMFTELGCTTCSALQEERYTQKYLKELFGNAAGEWLFQRCRGIDTDLVAPSAPPKTIMSSMTLTPFGPKEPELQNVLGFICGELSERLQNDYDEFNRMPTVFSLHYRNLDEKEKAVTVPSSKVVTSSGSPPLTKPNLGYYDPKSLTILTKQVFLGHVGTTTWNLRWLGIIVSNFEVNPVKDGGIAKFFKPKGLVTSNTLDTAISLDTPPDDEDLFETQERPKRKAEEEPPVVSAAKRTKIADKPKGILAFFSPK